MAATERTTLHFDFGGLPAEHELTLHFQTRDVPLRRHTATTRAEARERYPIYWLIPDERLTHHVTVDLPTDVIALRWVTTEAGRVVHMAINISSAGRRHARALYPAGNHGHVNPKLAWHRITRTQVAQTLGTTDDGIPTFPDGIDDYQSACDAAVALVYHHGALINLNSDNGGSVPSIIVDQCINPAIQANSYTLPDTIRDEGNAWLVQTPLPVDGNPQVDSTISQQPTQTVMDAAAGPIALANALAQDNLELQGQTWNLEYGTTSTDYGSATLLRAGAASGGWTARVLTAANGLTVDTGSVLYDPPPSSPSFTTSGVWSINSTPPLTEGLVKQILDGNAYVLVTADSAPGGLLRGALGDPSIDDSGCTHLTASLTGSGGTGNADCSLNSGQSGFSYTVMVDLTAPVKGLQCAIYVNDIPQWPVPLTSRAGMGTLSLQCTNSWLRHLSLYVQYFDTKGCVLTPPAWDEQIPGWLAGIYEPDPAKHYVTMIQPVTTVFGVPLPPNPVRVTVPVWDEVSTIRFRWGGLGRGTYDSAACPMGIVATVLAELVLPPFLLVAGAAVTNSTIVKSIMADKEVLLAVAAVGGFLFAGGTATYIGTAQDPVAATAGLAAKFGPMLLSPATSLGKWVAAKIVEGAAEKAAPFVDIALAVINGAVTAAQLAQTTIEVLDSPFVYETDLVRTLDLTVTLRPDPHYSKFPDYHDHFIITAVYDTATSVPLLTKYLPATTVSDPITVEFPSVPSGGSFQIFAVFYAADGWQSGQGSTDWMPALSDQGRLSVDITVTTNKIPLSGISVYQHVEKIEPVNGKLTWVAAPAPTATPQSAPPYAPKAMIQRWQSITIAQSPEMIGYCWLATGLNLPPDSTANKPSTDALWALQNLSVLQYPPQGLSSPAVGFSQLPGVAYDIASPDDGSGNNFFIDSTGGMFDPDDNREGGYHIRRLSLTHTGPGPQFAVASKQSYGRFPFPGDRYAYHPQGVLFGIAADSHKLLRVPLTNGPVADQDAPLAVLSAGKGTRPGLMNSPVALAVALDGRVLVLESGNARIQAFDLYGKPVRYFADPDDPDGSCTLSLTRRKSATYLDMAVESAGYIYVLSTTSPAKSDQYHLDLYQPDGTFLVTTSGVCAAAITVDLLRTIYALNYEQIMGGDGHVQPSISQWLPPAPAAGLAEVHQ